MGRIFTDADYAKLVPLWGQVVVKIERPPERSVGGIVLPEEFRDREKHSVIIGRIVSQGPMAFVYNISGVPERMTVPDGSLVVFKPYAGDLHEANFDTTKRLEDQPYRILNSSDIIGVIPGE